MMFKVLSFAMEVVLALGSVAVILVGLVALATFPKILWGAVKLCVEMYRKEAARG